MPGADRTPAPGRKPGGRVVGRHPGRKGVPRPHQHGLQLADRSIETIELDEDHAAVAERAVDQLLIAAALSFLLGGHEQA
jgi:hypothetical protein